MEDTTGEHYRLAALRASDPELATGDPLVRLAVSAFLPADDVDTAFRATVTGSAWRWTDRDTLIGFAAFPDPLLLAIADRLPGAGQSAREQVVQAVKCVFTKSVPVTRMLSPKRPADRIAAVSNAFAFMDVLDAVEAEKGWGHRASALAGALDMFEVNRIRPTASEAPAGPVSFTDYLCAGEDERARAAASVLCHLLTRDIAEPFTAVPERTAEAIGRNLSGPARIIALLTERRTLDPDTIVPVLDATTPALAEGIL